MPDQSQENVVVLIDDVDVKEGCKAVPSKAGAKILKGKWIDLK